MYVYVYVYIYVCKSRCIRMHLSFAPMLGPSLGPCWAFSLGPCWALPLGPCGASWALVGPSLGPNIGQVGHPSQHGGPLI